MRRFILAGAGLLACCASAQALGAPALVHRTTEASTEAKREAAIRWLSTQVYGYQQTTWRWERLMDKPRTQTEGRVLAEMSIQDVQQAVLLWKRRAAQAIRLAHSPPHLRAFLCIHRYEGSWRDAGGPYYGGLQMDLGFQAAFGRFLLRTEGTADHWSPLEQIWVAEKALRSRGFWPWPNTARACGLI